MLQVGAEHCGERLDRFISTRVAEMSRAYAQELIRAGKVTINHNRHMKPAGRLKGGETVEVELGPRAPLKALPEAIDLDVIYEDEDIAAVNKPAGLAVHPGAGRSSGTLVGALLHRFANLSSHGGSNRPGIVHRIDRLTSGVIVIAKNDFAHQRLAEQFQKHTVTKKYIALVHGNVKSDKGRIDAPISRDLRRRTRMTTRRQSGREAHTEYRVMERFAGDGRVPSYTLLEISIHTGRTHQIRVHLSSIKYPVVGDRVYGAPTQLAGPGSLAGFSIGRQFLHASELEVTQPRTGVRLRLTAPLASELEDLLAALRKEFRQPGNKISPAADVGDQGDLRR